MGSGRPTFGVLLPAWSDAARPDGCRRVARTAERAGFDAVRRGDRVVFPEEIPEGGSLAEIDTVAYDVFQALAAVATVAVLSFVVAYNEFSFSFPMTDGRPENRAPLLWGIRPYGGRLAAAASIVGVVPMAAIVLLAQRRIVSGLARGAVRE
jgi:hypothetical protein